MLKDQPPARVPRLNPKCEVRKLPLVPQEAYVLSRVDGIISTAELVLITGLPQMDVARHLAHLTELGAIFWEADAGRSVAPPDGGPHSQARPGRVEATVVVRTPSPPPPISVIVSPRPAVLPQPLVEDDELDIAPDKRRKIDELFFRLNSLNHYEVLNVARDAAKKEIKDAYYQAASEYHPDRFFRKRIGPYKSRVEAIFGRITLAHDTLVRAQLRAEYDASLNVQRTKVGIEALLREGDMQAERDFEAMRLADLRKSMPPRSSEPAFAAVKVTPPRVPTHISTVPPERESIPSESGRISGAYFHAGEKRSSSDGPRKTPSSDPARRTLQSDTGRPSRSGDPPLRNPSVAPPANSTSAARGSDARSGDTLVQGPSASNAPSALSSQRPSGRPSVAEVEQMTAKEVEAARARRDAFARRLSANQVSKAPGPMTSITPSRSVPSIIPPSGTLNPPSRSLNPPPPSGSPSGQSIPVMPSAEDLRRRFIDRQNQANRQQANKYVEAAQRAMARDDAASAANAYRLALALVPEDLEIQKALKDAQRTVGLALAGDYLKQAECEERLEHWPEAARAYGRAADALVDDAKVQNLAAQSMLRVGLDLHKAAAYAKRATELAPNFAAYHLTLGQVYVAAGLGLNARRELEAAAGLAPDDASISELLKKLRRG